MNKFKCEHCDKTFTTKTNLKTHMNTAKYCLDIQGSKILNPIMCEFCDRAFTKKIIHDRHVPICEARKLKIRDDEFRTQAEEFEKITQDLEQRNEQLALIKLKLKEKDKAISKLKLLLQENTESIKDLKLEKEDLNDEVTKLKEELAFEKGKIEGYQTTKPPTINNQYIHPKLKDVPILNILPLDDSVEAYLYKYNYDTFLRATKGAVEMLLEIVIFEDENGIINRNCVCTNRARNSFHILVNDKKWTKDNGASCIHSYLNMLKPLVNTHYAAFNVIMDDLITNGDALDMQLIRKRHAKLTPFRNGILGKPGMEAREKLLVDVRAGIRDQTSI